MAQVEGTSSGRRHPERFGLGAAALQAAIQADLEESGSEPTAETIASAAARAIVANNEELLRQLIEMLTADRSSIDRR